MKHLELKTLVIVVASVVLYGIFDAAKDTLAHHFTISVFSDLNSTFWDANNSWCNKWKNCEVGKEAFWGASTIFSAATDGWHLMKFFTLKIFLIFPAFVLTIVTTINHKFWNKDAVKFVGAYFGLMITQALVFNLFYHYIFLK